MFHCSLDDDLFEYYLVHWSCWLGSNFYAWDTSETSRIEPRGQNIDKVAQKSELAEEHKILKCFSCKPLALHQKTLHLKLKLCNLNWPFIVIVH